MLDLFFWLRPVSFYLLTEPLKPGQKNINKLNRCLCRPCITEKKSATGIDFIYKNIDKNQLRIRT